MKKRTINLRFPTGGVNRRYGYQSQPPFTTPEACNVVPSDIIDGRERGGSRPGMLVYTSATTNPVRFRAETFATGTAPAENILVDADFSSYPATDPTTWFTPFTYTGHPTSFRWTSGNGYVQSQTSATPAYSAYLFNVSDLDNTKQSVFTMTLGLNGSIGVGDVTFEILALVQQAANNYAADGLRVILKNPVTATQWRPQLVGCLNGYKYLDFTSTDYKNVTTSTERIVTFELSMVGKYATVKFDGVTYSDVDSKEIGFKENPGDPSIAPYTTRNMYGFAVPNGTSQSAFKVYGCSLQYYQTTESTITTPKYVDVVYGTGATGAASKSFMRTSSLSLAELSGSDDMLTGNLPISGVVINGKLYFTEGRKYLLKNSANEGYTNDKYLKLASGASATGVSTTRDVAVVYNSSSSAPVDGTFSVYAVDTGSSPNKLTLKDKDGDYMAAYPGDKATCYIVGSGILEYDPSNDTRSGTPLKRLLSGQYTTDSSYKGIVPIGCSILAAYRNRLFAAGDSASPHAWYCSRVDYPDDWDYGATTETSTMAVAGTMQSSYGSFQNITALVPWENDYLIFSSQNELHVMRGDPLDGVITVLGRGSGILSSRAYCFTDDGTLVYLATNGLWVIPPGGIPQPFSSETVPESLVGLSASTHWVYMGYDRTYRAVILVVQSISNPTFTYEYWWIDWDSKSFWPFTLPTSANIYSFAQKNGILLCGCYDGSERYFTSLSSNVGNTATSSYVVYGPFLLAGDATLDGVLEELQMDLSADTQTVTWKLYTGNDAATVVDAATVNTTPQATGSLTASSTSARSQTYRPRIRGTWACLRLESTSTWAIERLQATISTRGRHR